MSQATQTAAATDGADIDNELNDLIAELEGKTEPTQGKVAILEPVPSTAVEITADEVTSDDLQEAEAPVELTAKQKAAAKKADKAAAAEAKKAEKAAAAEAKKAAAEAKKAEKAAAKPKSVVTKGLTFAEALVTIDPENWATFLAHNGSEHKKADFAKTAQTRLDGMNAMAKKQQDKAINLAKWFLKGSKLRSYTEMALEVVIDKTTITSADIRDMFLAKNYGTGTANSLTNQYMNLFVTFGVATKGEDRSITLNANSPIVKLLSTK